MGRSKLSPNVPFSIFLILLIRTNTGKSLCHFDRIFVFGDSMADAGNLCRLVGGVCGALPYGETYFHKPNGRWCDGRLIADFIGFPAPLSACCGAPGEPYEFNSTMFCGSRGSQSCADPSKYISWDGDHLTEAANRVIANSILYGPYAIPPL